MSLMDKYTDMIDGADEMVIALDDQIEASVASEDALRSLLSELQGIKQLLEFWGGRLEGELDDYELERIAVNAEKQVRRHHVNVLEAEPEPDILPMCEYCKEEGSDEYKDGLCERCYNELKKAHSDDDYPRRGRIS